MTIQTKEPSDQKEMQEEMVGVLTAISIVSKRLANRLTELDEETEPDDGSIQKKHWK